MKKQILYLGMAIMAIAFASCKDSNSFTISGTVTNPGSLKKVILFEQNINGASVVDSTNLSEDGKFKFKYAAPYANLFRIRLGGSVFDFIAKNGDDISFSTNLTDSAHAYTITGSDDSEKIKEFNKISNAYGDKIEKIEATYASEVQSKGKNAVDSLRKVYMPLFMKVFDAGSQSIIKFMNANKHSLAGFYAASSLDSIKYESQLVAYADSIKDDFKANPSVQRFIKTEMAIKPVSVGHMAPDFTVGGIDGKPIKLSDYKGKYVMLDFWASWCGPCRQENPNVVKQYAIYKPLGLNILGISLDTDKKAWEQAVSHDHLSWAHGSDLKNFEGPTEKLYHIYQIPSNFIINPQGIIVAKNLTGTDLEEFLNKTFHKAQ